MGEPPAADRRGEPRPGAGKGGSGPDRAPDVAQPDGRGPEGRRGDVRRAPRSGDGPFPDRGPSPRPAPGPFPPGPARLRRERQREHRSHLRRAPDHRGVHRDDGGLRRPRRGPDAAPRRGAGWLVREGRPAARGRGRRGGSLRRRLRLRGKRPGAAPEGLPVPDGPLQAGPAGRPLVSLRLARRAARVAGDDVLEPLPEHAPDDDRRRQRQLGRGEKTHLAGVDPVGAEQGDKFGVEGVGQHQPSAASTTSAAATTRWR